MKLKKTQWFTSPKNIWKTYSVEDSKYLEIRDRNHKIKFTRHTEKHVCQQTSQTEETQMFR